MNNVEVQRLLDECSTELSKVKTLIDGVGIASNIAPYLTKYSLIRACGTIEQAFKSIICDFCSRRSKKQVKHFLEQRVRDSSMNPTYSNICKLLKGFDEDWLDQFKTSIDNSPHRATWMTSLQSLVDARNHFAHGGNPSASIGDVTTYYQHCRAVIEALDSKVI
jgi:hypothetical protein